MSRFSLPVCFAARATTLGLPILRIPAGNGRRWLAAGKRRSLLAVAVAFSAATAQNPTLQDANTQTLRLTLPEAVEYARQHLDAIRVQLLNVQQAEYQQQAAERRYLPVVTAAADVRYNAVLQTNVLPGTLRGRPEDERIAVQFGTPWNTTLAADATYHLLEPGRRLGVEEAQLRADIARQTALELEQTAVAEVKRAYLGVILAQEQQRLAAANAERAQRVWQRAVLRVQQAQAQPIEADRLEVDYRTLAAQAERYRRTELQNRIVLAYRLGLPPGSEVIATDTDLLQKLYNQPSVLPDTARNDAVRAEERRLLLGQQQAQLAFQRTRQGYLPTVSLYGYAATQAFRQEFDVYDTRLRWFPVSYVGLRVNVPVFDGRQRASLLDQQRVQQDIARLQREAFAKQLQYEVTYAQVGLRNAYYDLRTTAETLQLADSVLLNTQRRYEQGQTDVQPVLDAQRTQLDAQTQYLANLHAYLLAEFELDRALGRRE
jgi:outer membrane protein TolC